MTDIAVLARIVDDAARHAVPIDQLSHSEALSVNQAYDIQYASIDRRLGRGESIIGLKMGFTSREKAEQMGVHELIYGWLTDRMLVDNGDTISLDRFIHPRAEPELAVRMARSLSGSPSWEEAWDAVECVAPAIEIIDSRYQNFRFSLADVVADNSSSSALVLGQWRDKPDDPRDLPIELSFDADVVASGSTANVMGNPAIAIATGAEMLARRQRLLEPGWIVMTGGATAAQALRPGLQVEAGVETIGNVSFQTASG